MHIFKFLKPGLTNFNVEQSISTRSLKESQVSNLPGNLPRQGEIDLWRHTGDEITFCWSFNKLSCETHCNTILSGKQKRGWGWLCVLVCWVWSHSVYLLPCYWGVGLSASTDGKVVHLSFPKGGEEMGKLVQAPALLQGTAWEDGRVSPHPIHAIGNGFSPFSCSDCSQQG